VVRATVKAAGSIPVSVKLRLGLDEDRFTFRDAARIAEEEGCAYVGLHARTMAQFYTGTARWQYIRELKEQVKIPVLGNGDVFTAARCKEMIEATGCDGVIIGRGCLGNPWLFQELKAMFDGAPAPRQPTLDEVLEIIRLHYRLLRSHFSLPKVADMMIRKFGTWYVRGLRHAAGIRRQFQEINGPDDVERVLEEMARAGWQEGFRPFEPKAVEPAVGECGA
jgi:nifR3 family TIM-barrel protein